MQKPYYSQKTIVKRFSSFGEYEYNRNESHDCVHYSQRNMTKARHDQDID